jgi:hypothetical protein
MSLSPGELAYDELARRCRQESERYLAGRSHDETYCFELFRRAIFDHDQAAWQAIYAQYQTWSHTGVGSTVNFSLLAE